MTAVIYARYSSDNQREESIEGQIRECTAYAEKNGITIVKHYIDRAISAKTDNRPEFQQMIKDSDKKLFDIVLVWKLDRFARNRYDSARYKTQLKKNGVKLVSATEIISEGPEGIILESVLEGYAEYYSADLSEKVVRGMTENALKGIYNGGTIPFGYMIDETRHYQPCLLYTSQREEPYQVLTSCDGAGNSTFLRDAETGGAWLSSARVVRCWVKSRNERNPYGQLLRKRTLARLPLTKPVSYTHLDVYKRQAAHCTPSPMARWSVWPRLWLPVSLLLSTTSASRPWVMSAWHWL